MNTNISDLRIACSKELALCHGRNLQPVAYCKADFFAIDNDLAFAGKNTVDFLICLVGVNKWNICSRRKRIQADLRTSQGELIMKLRPIFLSKCHY